MSSATAGAGLGTGPQLFHTEYDWRIGVLNRTPIVACQYFMSKGHWQSYNHKTIHGECWTLAVHEAPGAGWLGTQKG